MQRMLVLVLALFAPSLAQATRAADADSSSEPLPPDLGTRTVGVDWPDFLGPHRDGRSPETGLRTDWTDAKLPIVWQCELGESYGAPSISRGRLFHFDRHEDVHRLTCRNAETGAEMWTYDVSADYSDMLGYNNGPRATPVVDGNRAYVVTPEGALHCVSVTDGKPVWSIDTIKKFGVVKNFFGVASTPLVWGDVLIVNVGGSPPGSPADVYTAAGNVKGNGTGVVALDKRTGEVRWQATDELASYASPVVVEISDRPHCFVFARGGLVALDPRTGAVDFQFPWRAVKLESVNASSPVVVGDEVFISESYGPGSALLKVKPGGYDVVWKDDDRSREKSLELHWNTAVHHDGYLYASSGQHTAAAELRCVEWKSGKVKWSEPGLGRSSLLYVDGCLVCLSEEGQLRLLRATPERYEVLADLTPTAGESAAADSNSAVSEKLPHVADSLRESNAESNEGEPVLTSPAWTAPVLAHGLLYVHGANRLVCLKLIE